MFVGYSFDGYQGFINMDAVKEVWVEGDNLRLSCVSDSSGTIRGFRYESEEEAENALYKLYNALSDKSETYWLPEIGFLAWEKILSPDLSEFSKSKREDGMSDALISKLQSYGYHNLGDVVSCYDINRRYCNMGDELNRELVDFLDRNGLELQS